ncbi:MAG: hypothetical protein LBU11_09260 [Zoogloeaceae bacterium]|jgi:hypothetical protein|nr:hypothetical protein [Zoogloeaceae bacterium]
MFRFFLFMACVMATGASAAGGVSPCANTVPIQIMTPGYNNEIEFSAAKIPDHLSHFRAFVTAVTERVNSRLTENKLCVTGAKNMESMRSAAWERRSRLQFMHWELEMYFDYLVPVLPSRG